MTEFLVELPGLKDPERIKSLLGKTANLSFQFVSQKAEETLNRKIKLTIIPIGKKM